VQFRSTPDGKVQVLGGQIELYACNVSEAAEDIRSGVIRPLGVMSPTRSKFIPNVPTFREQGFNEVWSTSRGVAAPPNLPADVKNALIAALEKTIVSPDHKKKAEALSLDPDPIKGDAYGKFLKDNEQATKRLMKW
jgi:tripartite-type tricarboxylate transporter receptor subunit TctC